MEADDNPFHNLGNNYPPHPGYQGGRAPVARFLLGMGPLPPPRPEQLAANFAMAGLDGRLNPPQPPQMAEGLHGLPIYGRGLAGQADPQGAAPGVPGLGNYYRPVGSEQISALVPLNTTRPDESVVQASFKIPANHPPSAFRHEIHRLMGIEPGQHVRLGYRVTPASKSEPFVRFETDEDVAQAVTTVLTRMKRAVSRPVVLEVNNLDYKPSATPAGQPSSSGAKKNEPPRPQQSAYAEELRICKEKLHCERCSAANGTPTWCYIDRATSEHVRLWEEHVTLWARMMHNGECDRDCNAAPNCLKLDELRQQARSHARRRARSKNVNDATPSGSHVHVHIGSPHRSHRHSSGQRSRRSHQSRQSSHRSHRSRSRTSDSSSSPASGSASSSSKDESDTEGESLLLSDVLVALDVKQPAACYLSFAAALAAKGILYAASALDFSVDWYIQQVGMPDGLVKPLLRQVEVMLRKRRRQGKESERRKRTRISDENIDPALA